MKHKDIAELKTNRAIASLISEFEQKMKIKEDSFDFSFYDITAQTETNIAGVGLIGIEIVNQYLDVFDAGGIRVDLYTMQGDEWVRCFSQKIDGYATVQLGVWDTVATYREKLKRKAKNEKKRKYRKGDSITSVNELLDQELVYWNDKITHRGWFLSWQLKMTMDALERGVIHYAILKDDNDG